MSHTLVLFVHSAAELTVEKTATLSNGSRVRDLECPQKHRSSLFDDPAVGPIRQVDDDALVSMKSLFFPLLNAPDRSGYLRTSRKGPFWSDLEQAPARAADC